MLIEDYFFYILSAMHAVANPVGLYAVTEHYVLVTFLLQNSFVPVFRIVFHVIFLSAYLG
jgi:hypothetical protein